MCVHGGEHIGPIAPREQPIESLRITDSCRSHRSLAPEILIGERPLFRMGEGSGNFSRTQSFALLFILCTLCTGLLKTVQNVHNSAAENIESNDPLK
jgi:hypothetical protein